MFSRKEKQYFVPKANNVSTAISIKHINAIVIIPSTEHGLNQALGGYPRAVWGLGTETGSDLSAL